MIGITTINSPIEKEKFFTQHFKKRISCLIHDPSMKPVWTQTSQSSLQDCNSIFSGYFISTFL